ncbi:MAG: KEOPS complex subunit Pcc1 [Candidatus Hodarchaeales archaeon]
MTQSKADAQIIHDSLNPDNLAKPPVTITSEYHNKILEVKISGLTSLNSANATIIDLLDSYDLNDQIIRKIDEIV